MADEQTELPLETAKTEDAAALREALASARAAQTNLEAENTRLRGQVTEGGRRLHTESTARFQAEETAVDNAIAAAKNEADALETEYAGHLAEGRFKEAAAAQRKLAQAAARTEQYTQRKEYLASQKERLTAEPEPQQQVDGFTQFVNAYPENVRGWIREHRRFYDDPKYRAAVTGAANSATAKGIAVGTPDYYKFVETRAAEDLGEGERIETTRPQPETTDTETTQEDAVAVESERPAPPQPIPANARAEEPQQRAAGPGALRNLNSIAARPTRTSASVPASRARPTLSPEEAASAMALAQSLEPRNEKGQLITNPADIYKWYYDMNNSPSAERRRAKWYGTGGAA